MLSYLMAKLKPCAQNETIQKKITNEAARPSQNPERRVQPTIGSERRAVGDRVVSKNSREVSSRSGSLRPKSIEEMRITQIRRLMEDLHHSSPATAEHDIQDSAGRPVCSFER